VNRNNFTHLATFANSLCAQHHKRLKMIGNLAALRNYVDATLQVPVVAREAIIAQVLSSFEDFECLIDQDMRDVCANARKPGGTIQNPNWVAGGGNMP
jgi:hypothetical protein